MENLVSLHGELVAFGTLSLLAIENRSNDDFENVMKLCNAVGLPTTLEELGIVDDVEAKIRQVSVDATKQAPKYHMPPNATPDVIYDAIMRVDQVGKKRKGGTE